MRRAFWRSAVSGRVVERSFAWLGRNRRLSKDYEYRVQTSETMIDLASIRLMLSRIGPV
jgi:transposase